MYGWYQSLKMRFCTEIRTIEADLLKDKSLFESTMKVKKDPCVFGDTILRVVFSLTTDGIAEYGNSIKDDGNTLVRHSL